MPLLNKTVVESRKESIGSERGGSVKDLEMGIELGSRDSCAIYRRTNREAIGADNFGFLNYSLNQ